MYATATAPCIKTRCWAIALALALCLTPYFAANMTAQAATPPSIIVNDTPLETSVTPIMVENRLMVSVADFAHLVGGSVHLHSPTGVMRFLSPVAGFILQSGDRAVYGHPEITEQPVAPVMRGDHLMVSVRFLAEAFGWELDWDASQHAVVLHFEPVDTVPVPEEASEEETDDTDDNVFSAVDYHPTEEEMELFVRTVSAESPNEPLEGQTAVAAVIVNRVLSDDFPNTLWEVLTAPNQFCVVENGQVERPIVDGAEEAVQRALAGEDPSEGAFFFFAFNRVSRNTQTGAWMYSLPETVRIGVHSFRAMPK